MPRRRIEVHIALLILLAFLLVLCQLLGLRNASEGRTYLEATLPSLNLEDLAKTRIDKLAGGSHSQKKINILLAGIIKSPINIRNGTWSLLADLSCQHHVSIHVIISENATSDPNPTCIRWAMQQYKLINTRDNGPPHKRGEYKSREECFGCAPVWIELENSLLQGRVGVQALFPSTSSDFVATKIPIPQQRIERLALLRDVQRTRIQQLFFHTNKNGSLQNEGLNLDESVIIVVDLDLVGVPTGEEVMKRVQLLRRSATTIQSNNGSAHPRRSGSNSASEVHVICAAGGEGMEGRQHRYYDTFSTILLPDTFVYPRFWRYNKRFNGPNENRSLVVVGPFYTKKKKVKNPFTQADLMTHLRQEAKFHAGGLRLTPVRSCFGGMAIYRGRIWLSPMCHYRRLAERISLPESLLNNVSVSHRSNKHDSALLLKYAGAAGHPCEHVVLHECLHHMRHTNFSEAPPFVTIDTSLQTYWWQ